MARLACPAVPRGEMPSTKSHFLLCCPGLYRTEGSAMDRLAEFLKEIEGWREALARNIALRNKDLHR